ncbi:MAG: DUF3572 domain-containing protein [Pseudorhodoplanes sp.]|nr:DUF3572 domain-containing protein [Pseudorhodoplanes sp.]
MVNKPEGPVREVSEAVAVRAFAFIAGDVERLGAFLAATGIGPDMIRKAARDPGFLGGVLDYVAGDESLLVACAKEIDLKPEDIMRAHAVLSGGPHERDVP